MAKRHVFSAAFIGKMTAAEFRAAYPTYAKLGASKQSAGEFAPLAAYLPKELGTVPHPQLRVCEAAVQLDFFENLFPGFVLPHAVPDAVTFFSWTMEWRGGGGGIRLG